MRDCPLPRSTIWPSTRSRASGAACSMAPATSQRGLFTAHAGLQRRLAADAGAAAGPGAAAVGRHGRVACDHPHLVDGHADALSHDLADDGLRALALLGDAGRRHHRAVRVDAHAAAVLRRDPRPADAVHEGARVGQLDEAGKADAAMDAACAQPLLLGAQARVVDHGQQLVERGLVGEALELHAGGRGARIAAVAHQVAAAEFYGVEAQRLGGKVHQPLGDGRGDRVADGAVLAGGRLVLQHHRGLGAVVGKVVGPADQVHHLVAFDRAGARIDRIGADAREVVDVDGE